MRLLFVLSLFLLWGCSVSPSKVSSSHPVVQDIEVGKIYKVRTKQGEQKVVEVKSVTDSEVVGLRQTVALDNIESVEHEVSDPPKSAVKVVASVAYVGILTVAVLLILILI